MNNLFTSELRKLFKDILFGFIDKPKDLSLWPKEYVFLCRNSLFARLFVINLRDKLIYIPCLFAFLIFILFVFCYWERRSGFFVLYAVLYFYLYYICYDNFKSTYTTTENERHEYLCGLLLLYFFSAICYFLYPKSEFEIELIHQHSKNMIEFSKVLPTIIFQYDTVFLLSKAMFLMLPIYTIIKEALCLHVISRSWVTEDNHSIIYLMVFVFVNALKILVFPLIWVYLLREFIGV